ncbi:MAG TPA: isocitrate lyase/phosphoenolpyruvate mutase family protein [Chitinophagaceae bacterium]|jgi:2-methylisocitrate lyase-like PEP mutase family enzyme|nr:isocitrate lyase/phosphoenolpyruvate mutase family protein [Chitinophagaceae bacterium]
MSTTFKKFKDLHESAELFVLPNAWNAKSALVFQEKKFPAIGTSSAAVANSLGYEDGEEMPFNDYLFVINRILSSIQIPLSVDVEMGYGTSDEEIFANILNLAELGVAGINIEDSTIHKSGRVLKDAKSFAKTIEYVKNKLVSKSLNLFINIRCDTFILNVKNKQQETSNRLRIYEATGADGIFLPCICTEDDIAEAVSNTKLPLNVMCIPGLPHFEILNKLGVKRVSMGPFLFNKIYDNAGQLSQAIIANKSFSPILS